jgi:hypothetical protein
MLEDGSSVLKGFSYRRTGFGFEKRQRRTKRGEWGKKINFDQPKEEKKNPQVKQTGLDHK